jgi:hypothetical protein
MRFVEKITILFQKIRLIYYKIDYCDYGLWCIDSFLVVVKMCCSFLVGLFGLVVKKFFRCVFGYLFRYVFRGSFFIWTT